MRRLPAFRDITLGGNAVATAGPGYDLVTGLGTPDVDNLARNILVLQKVIAEHATDPGPTASRESSARAARSTSPPGTSAGCAAAT